MGSGGDAKTQRSVRGENVYGPYVKVRYVLFFFVCGGVRTMKLLACSALRRVAMKDFGLNPIFFLPKTKQYFFFYRIP